MGGRQPHRSINSDFTLALIYTADHGVQHDENRNNQWNDNIGHTAVTHAVAGMIEIGTVFFAAEEGQSKAVN